MRQGFNPNKDKPQQASEFWHQVVVPVYIPNSEDYFKDSFDILKLCLESLKKTTHKATYITVVNNGSGATVSDYLQAQLQSGVIHEVIHSPNIGKINAILKGVVGHDFDLVTITDADVLFHEHWQKATYEIFEAFPQAGAVAPLSFPNFLKYFTGPVWTRFWLSKKLRFEDVSDPESLKAFADSINNEDYYKEAHLQKQLILENNGVKAGVGSGHFVNTYRGSVFDPPAGKHSPFHLGGGSETKFVDAPVVQAGGFRLSTLKGHASHMGNTLAPWMQDTVSKLVEQEGEITKPVLKELPSAGYNGLLFKLITRGPIWRFLLKRKGLSGAQAKQY